MDRSPDTIEILPDHPEDGKPNRVTLVLLLGGLPGAGKSSIATALKEQVASSLPVHHIEYDGIEDSILDETRSDKYDDENDDDESTSKIDVTPRLEAWRRSRKVALERLTETLAMKEESSDGENENMAEDNSTIEYCIERIILMDDNYYLRSMRKQVFMTCQQFIGDHAYVVDSGGISKVAMVSMWLETSIEECLARNQERPPNRQVPSAVIQRMGRQMEPPETRCNTNPNFESDTTESSKGRNLHWEQVVWRLSGDDSVESNVTKLLDFLRNDRDWLSKSIVPPPIDPQIEMDRVATERQRTKESMRHQIDQTLRKAVRIVASNIHKKYARAANDARKQVLADDTVETCTDAMQRFCHALLAATGLETDEEEILRHTLSCGE